MSRTITTRAELDALPFPSAVTLHGEDWHKQRDGSWLCDDGYILTAGGLVRFAERGGAPLTVLHDLPASAPAPSVVPEDQGALVYARAFVQEVIEVINDDAGDDPDPQWVYDRLVESLAVIENLTAALPFLTAAPSATRDEVARAADAGIRGTTDGDLIDADADIPAGEAVRLATDALLARYNMTPKEDR